jgi:predicted Zn-dependent protease
MVGHYRKMVMGPATYGAPPRLRRLLALALLCVAFAGCAQNPQSGRRELILMSEEREKEIDEEQAQQVEQQLGLVADPELASYVQTLGAKLASYALRRDVSYVFNVVEMEEPNAFALPGGHIYVSRGLLVLSNSEAELANVIGHEIGHVTSRHAAQRDARAKTATVLTVLAAVAAAAAGAPDVAMGLGQYGPLAAMGLLAAYSRDQEREADQIGQDLAARAGVDPAGMAQFLRLLENYTRLKQGASQLPSFFDTHPSTPERVAETSTRAQVIRWQPGFAIAPTRDAYLARLEGLAVGLPASEGVFQDDRFLHPELGFALRFPDGWTHQNQRSRLLSLSPRRDAVVVLELQGTGEDPKAAALDYAKKNDLRLYAAQPLKLGDLSAFRVRTVLDSPWGPASAEITWIAQRGRIYRLSAAAPGSSFPRYEGVFRSFARSFRSLRAEERASITELRMRLATARADETLADLSRRTGNEWNLNETAVMNGMVLGQPLRAGTLVKIARREPYVGKPAAEPPGEAPAAGTSGEAAPE